MQKKNVLLPVFRFLIPFNLRYQRMDKHVAFETFFVYLYRLKQLAALAHQDWLKEL